MTKVMNVLYAVGAALIVGLPAFAVEPPAAGETTDHPPCFFITQWKGWKSPSPQILYLGVNLHDVYQVDLTGQVTPLREGDEHLIVKVRGGDSICSALDLDLQVADNTGFRQPLFPTNLTKLTPKQVAAIPPKFRP